MTAFHYISSSLYYVNLFFPHHKFAKYEMDYPIPSTDFFYNFKAKVFLINR